MFAYLEGQVLNVDGVYLTVLVKNTGLGMEVLASPSILHSASEGREISLWIHHHITDVSEMLFGFASQQEKKLFKNLIKVSGIGGKTALNMLELGEEILLKAIQDEDDSVLATVPGIGKKTAQKIIVDIKGSINFDRKQPSNNTQNIASENQSLLSSLVTMGYDKTRVENILQNIDKSLSIDEKVKMAIKLLG